MQLAGSRALTSPQNFIDDRRMTLLSLAGRMEQEMKLTLTDKRGKFASLAASLEALSPLSVIARGYSAVFDDAGNVVKSVEQLSPGDRFTFRTVDGSVVGETVEIIKENSNGK